MASFRPNPFLKRSRDTGISQKQTETRDTDEEGPMQQTQTDHASETEHVEYMEMDRRPPSTHMKHTLIRLRPSTAMKCRQQDHVVAKEKYHRPGLQQWLCVFLPVLFITMLVLYVLAELFLKWMAYRHLQSEWKNLPTSIENLPLAPSVHTPSVHAKSVEAVKSVLPPEVVKPNPVVVVKQNPPVVSKPSPPTVVVPQASRSKLPAMQFSAVPSDFRSGHGPGEIDSFTWDFHEP